MQAIFNCAGGDADMLFTHYKDLVSREFYDGEIGTSNDGPVSLFLEKGLSHPISVMHLSTPNRVTYRRTHRHIQQNQVDCYVVWRIRRGGIRLSRSSGSVFAGEDQILIYDSGTPFFTELACDDREMHESLQAIVPAHMFRDQVAGMAECSAVIDIKSPQARLAARMLDILSDEGHLLDRALGEKMVAVLLEAIGQSIGAFRDESLRRSLSNRRLEEIEQQIMRNLTSRDLSANAIAQACNISPRYLCYILKSAGYSFSQMVWDKRLEKAKEWLNSPRMQSYLVHEIASMAGYKSAAHFSRAFKSACGCTPSEYRRRVVASHARPHAHADIAVAAVAD